MGLLAVLNFVPVRKCAAAECNNPAFALWSRFYSAKIRNDKKYYIVPYNDNIIALYFLSKNKNIGIIKDYIIWYFKHLNYPDKFGLTGTMYDYTISRSGCKEKPVNTYDSADSYAATYIMLVNEYYIKTKDIKIVRHVFKKLKDVTYIINYLQDPKNGLIRVLKGKDEEYLMDNCEDYGGITAYLNLLKIMGRKYLGAYKRYKRFRKSIKTAIIKNLYNKRRHNFDWAVIDGRKRYSNWDIYYPDALAQLFPILYGIVNSRKISGKLLWNKFESFYGNKSDSFPLEQKVLYILTKSKANK